MQHEDHPIVHSFNHSLSLTRVLLAWLQNDHMAATASGSGSSDAKKPMTSKLKRKCSSDADDSDPDADADASPDTDARKPRGGRGAKRGKGRGGKAVASRKPVVVKRSDADKRSDAEKLVKCFSADVTGIYGASAGDGVRLVGAASRTTGAVAIYKGEDVHPLRTELARIQEFPDLWLELLQMLGTIPFYRDKTLKERGVWLLKSPRSKQESLRTAVNAQDACTLHFKAICGEKQKPQKNHSFATLDAKVQQDLLLGPQTLRRIESLLPNRSMGLYVSAWRVAPQPDPLEDFHGVMLTIGNEAPGASVSVFSKEAVKADGLVAILSDMSEGIAIFDPLAKAAPFNAGDDGSLCALLARVFGPDDDWKTRDAVAWKTGDTESHAARRVSYLPVTTKTFVVHWMRGLGGAWHRSLMQKLVRQRPMRLMSPLHHGHYVDAELALVIVFTELLAKPPQMGHHLNRSVSGPEHAFKRLAVCLVEESHPSDPNDVVFLLACAGMAKMNVNWMPNAAYVERACRIAIGTMRTSARTVYESAHATKEPFFLSSATGAWQLSSAMFNSIGGMAGDTNMLHDVALRVLAKTPIVHDDKLERPESMSFTKCIDPHCATGAAYFLQYDYLHRQRAALRSERASTPFEIVFRNWFRMVTGRNSRDRRKSVDSNAEREMQLHVQEAQCRYWAVLATVNHTEMKQLASQEGAVTSGVRVNAADPSGAATASAAAASITTTIEETLPDAWLAGAVGHITVNTSDDAGKTAEYTVTLKTTDLSDMTVFPRISRDGPAQDKVSDDVRERAQAAARQLLSTNGVKWSPRVLPVPSFRGCTIRLADAHVLMKDDCEASEAGQAFSVEYPDGDVVPWSIARDVKQSFALFSAELDQDLAARNLPPKGVPQTSKWIPGGSDVIIIRPGIGVFHREGYLDWICSIKNDGIYAKAIERFKAGLVDIDGGILRRVVHHADASALHIAMPRMTRDGGSMDDHVSLDDVGVFQLFLFVAQHFPSALEFAWVKGQVGFMVKSSLLFRQLIGMVRDALKAAPAPRASDGKSATATASASATASVGWGKWKDTMRLSSGELRTPRPHQIESVARINARHAEGLTGHMIICPVGSGKTLITCQVIADRIAAGTMPDYCILSLPIEAISAVIHEFEAFGATINVMDPCVSSKMRTGRQFARYMDSHKAGRMTARPFVVNVVQHDHLAKILPQIPGSVISQCFFVLDEAQKALNNTLRTDAALQLASAVQEMIGMSGTFMMSDRLKLLMKWLSKISRFPVHPENMLVALSDTVAHVLRDRLPSSRPVVSATLDTEEERAFRAGMPIHLGGTKKVVTREQFAASVRITKVVCARKIVERTRHYLHEKEVNGVMLVVQDLAHAREMRRALVSTKVVSEDAHVVVLGDGAMQSIDLTASTVVKDPALAQIRVVITTPSKSTGYNLSHFNVMVSAVLLTNAAILAQLYGRIDRLGQVAEEVIYETVVDATGFWQRILGRQEYVRAFNELLQLAIAAPIVEN